MTPADVLRECAVAGVDVYLRPDGTPAVRGQPNAALLAALNEHRAGIVAALGGVTEPETCGECRALVRPENGRDDIGRLCDRKACAFKGRR